jgi:hypothetical protein
MVKSGTLLFSNVVEVFVSDRQVAANVFQNFHSLSKGAVEQSQSADIAVVDTAPSKHFAQRKTHRIPGNEVIRSTMCLKA